MRIIGLDVGEKRIGVAKVDSSTRIAIPIGFVINDDAKWQEIARIARMSGTDAFVLGLPRSNEGNETKQTLYVREFAKHLVREIPGAKVRFQDESLTSVEAESRLKARKKKYEKGEIDAEAASIILQDFVERYGGVDDSSFSDAPNGKKKKLPLILLIILLLGLAGATAVLKYRDYLRQKREEEYAKQEAADKAQTFSFTILPGETIFDIKKKLLTVDRTSGNEPDEEIPRNYTMAEVNAAFNASYGFDFLADRPVGATLEGYLFGETHEFYASVTVEDILRKFLEGTGKVIEENNLIERYAARGLTLYQGITLASIVQKEAPSSEQPTVAQIFLSRLAYGWRLGSDVTVSYALDVVDPDRTIYGDNTSALLIDSCYNTRLYTGLPCGPIANPGLSALLAVAEPSDTAYLYFLTGDDGLMYYSYTEAEHNQNIYRHCKVLCNVSL